MNNDRATDPPTSCASAHRVCHIAIPPAARALSTLCHLGYEDAFFLETSRTQDWTAEQWGRTILQDARRAVRSTVLLRWPSIGRRVGSGLGR